MHISRFVLFLSLVIAVFSVQADRLYKWVDKDGRVSYHDRPPPSGAVGVEEKEIGSRRPAAKEEGPRAAVMLYATPQCSSCELARQYMKKRGVPFTEKNAEKDLAIQDELRERTGGLMVPTIIVGEKIMRGYLESLLEGELDAAGYPRMAGSASGGTAAETPPAAESGLAPTR